MGPNLLSSSTFFMYVLDVTVEMCQRSFMAGSHWNRYASVAGADGLFFDPLPRDRNPFTNPRSSITSSYSPAKLHNAWMSIKIQQNDGCCMD